MTITEINVVVIMKVVGFFVFRCTQPGNVQSLFSTYRRIKPSISRQINKRCRMQVGLNPIQHKAASVLIAMAARHINNVLIFRQDRLHHMRGGRFEGGPAPAEQSPGLRIDEKVTIVFMLHHAYCKVKHEIG